MTPEQEHTRVQRTLRTIPLEAIAPDIAAKEAVSNGLWCLVAGEVSWVSVDGMGGDTLWDDEIVHAQYVRWLEAHSARVHDTYAAALAWVRSQLGGGPAA